MARHAITVSALVLALLAAGPALAANPKAGARIKKCQDAQGRWHYGDEAADACAQSKVIELDTRGIKRKEIDAPLTEAELKARAGELEEAEKAKKLAAQQKRRDDQLLATYAVEDDLVMSRDRKLADIETQIASGEATLASLRKSLDRIRAQAADEQRGGKPVSPQTAKTIAANEAQVAKHEAHIADLKKDQETVRAQFQNDIERFRELKGKSVVPPAPTETP
jgi:chromosome segregation ATPase